jgi:membrane protease YdiL (CAAX protease family)
VHWGLVVLTSLAAIPVILAIGGWMRLIDFGEAANRLHAQSEAAMKKLMDIRSGGRLACALLVMALLPAVGEELMFRGVLMRFAARKARSAIFPIAVSALMFALLHFNNPYGLLPIFMMGVLLALVYYWTRSLICSMVMHFLFNASQVFLYYLSFRNKSVKAIVDSESLSSAWILVSTVIFVGGVWLLWRARTPLPQPGWTADFSPEELAAREEEQQRLRM